MTSTATAVERATPRVGPDDDGYRRSVLVAGVLGRAWLWFLAGCLAVTLLPMLLGWRPYVIQSGSMQPRINVGDVVLASPTHDAHRLLGHVTVFEDPDFPGKMKTHRVIRIADDGRLVTKGDANQSPDSAPVRPDHVFGMGRLLVRFAGLPIVWGHEGKVGYLLLFAASIVLAAVAVARDREKEDEDDRVDGVDESGAGGEPDPEDVAVPLRLPFQRGVEYPPNDITGVPPPARDGELSRVAAPPVDPRRALRRARIRRANRRLAWRTACLLGLSLVLAVPTTRAAFASVTRNTADTFSVPNWNYTTEVNNLDPYLYWKLDETTGTSAADSSGNGHPGTYAGTFTRNVTGALVTETPNRAVTLTATTSCINTTSTTSINSPTPVTVMAWVKAPAGTNGKVVGFEKPRTGVAAPSTGTYDRMLYVDGSGRAWFAVYNNAYFAISSASSVTDNAWHMLVGTLGPAGMRLYVDGVQVASNANTGGEATTGWWRAGCGNLGGWGSNWTGANNPGTDSATTANRPFTNGSIDEVSVFTTQLTTTEVAFLYWIR